MESEPVQPYRPQVAVGYWRGLPRYMIDVRLGVVLSCIYRLLHPFGVVFLYVTCDILHCVFGHTCYDGGSTLWHRWGMCGSGRRWGLPWAW